MSYLNNSSSNLADFQQAIMSFWVRIPQTTLTKIVAAQDGDNGPFSGIAPFVTFGEAQTAYGNTQVFTTMATIEEVFGEGGDTGITLTYGDNVYSSTGAASYQAPPTFVGGAVYSDGSGARLQFNIQLAGRGACTGLRWTTGSIVADPVVHVYTNLSSISEAIQVQRMLADPDTIPCNMEWKGQDVTDIVLGGQNDSFTASTDIGLTPDMWHHILIAFDISGSCNAAGTQGTVEQLYYPPQIPAIPPDIPEGVIQASPPPGDKGTLSTSCQLWIAVDDVSYTGDDITGGNTTAWGLGPNDWATNLGERIAGTFAPGNGSGIQAGGIVPGPSGANLCTFNVKYSGNELPSYSYQAQGVPISGHPMGLPAAADFVSELYGIEMAEFQLFTGITIDTGVKKLRRLFIDADGKPVPPDQLATTDADGNVTQTSGSIEGLGRRPNILLHTASNWKKGRNTGTTGVDYTQTPPVDKPAGQFATTALITKYKPDPSLNGPQGPAS